MKKYLRYGEIPEDERSVNFMKLSFRENEDFTYDLIEMKRPRLEALKDACISRLYNKEITLDDILEPGVSVFNCDDEGNPIIENKDQAITLECLKKENRPCYIVTGDQVGIGQDGEPLIQNITILSEKE